jgi:hypothetical protein
MVAPVLDLIGCRVSIMAIELAGPTLRQYHPRKSCRLVKIPNVSNAAKINSAPYRNSKRYVIYFEIDFFPL